MDPGAQPSILGTEGATAEATWVARSRPRRAAAAAAAASIVQQHRVGLVTIVEQVVKLQVLHRNLLTRTRILTILCMVQVGSQSGYQGLYPRLYRICGSQFQNPFLVPAEISVTAQPLMLVVDAASSNSGYSHINYKFGSD
jgi:hypothetical protein